MDKQPKRFSTNPTQRLWHHLWVDGYFSGVAYARWLAAWAWFSSTGQTSFHFKSTVNGKWHSNRWKVGGSNPAPAVMIDSMQSVGSLTSASYCHTFIYSSQSDWLKLIISEAHSDDFVTNWRYTRSWIDSCPWVRHRTVLCNKIVT